MIDRRWVFGVLMVAALAACSGEEPTEELLERARSSLADGRPNAAVVDVKTALQRDADNPEARLLFGRAYMLQNDPASAVDEFRRAASSGNVEAEALYARALVAAGQSSDLVEFHEQSEPAPAAANAPVYLASLARAYSERGNAESADAALRQARKIPISW